jgi:hypothetical protein
MGFQGDEVEEKVIDLILIPLSSFRYPPDGITEFLAFVT